jgi:hypothetical protein
MHIDMHYNKREHQTRCTMLSIDELRMLDIVAKVSAVAGRLPGGILFPYTVVADNENSEHKPIGTYDLTCSVSLVDSDEVRCRSCHIGY